MSERDYDEPHIDDIDRGLIRLLQEDGRMSTCKIAAELDCMSDRAVRYRLARLQQNELIRVSAIVCTSRLGQSIMGDVFLDILPWKLSAIVKQLWMDNRVSYIAASPDKRQVSFQTNGCDPADLMRVVGEITAGLEGVNAVRVMPLSRLFRNVTSWMPPSGE